MANHTPEELASQIQQLSLAVADLRLRVSVLERTTDIEGIMADEPQPALSASAVAQTENAAPLFGWALLGLSGAYLFRALSESGAIPVLLGAAAGLVYAASWLAMSARRAWDQPLASIVHSITAALIVAPLLWEATVRLHLIAAPAATVVLIAFVVFGLAVAWRHSVNGIAWVVTLTGFATSVAIFRDTQDGRAWAIGVLLIAAGVEFSACRDHWLGLRWVAALNANFAVFALTLLVSRPHETVESTAMLSPMFVLGLQVGLLVVYLASTVDRTLVRKLNITGFEIGQAGTAFLVSIGGALYLAGAAEVDHTVVGALCAVFSVVAYVISFRVLEHSAERRRNFHAYSIFAVALMLVACRLLLPGEGAVVAYAALSVCAAALARSTSVRVQAAVFLVSAALTSHAITAAAGWLIHAQQAERVIPGAGYAATLIAACAYFRRARSTRHAESFASAALLAWLSAGFAAAWLPDPAMRTGVLAAMSILLAVAAARHSSRAFAWTSYVMLGTAGVKLVVEDLRLSGHSFAVFVSLALFGSALILAPRILRGHGARGWKALAAGSGGPNEV